MSVEVVDSSTIVNFVEDEEAFSSLVRDWFISLDTDQDGVLSYKEMLKEWRSLRLLETHYGVDVKVDEAELGKVYDSLFLQFDHDSNGVVDLDDFGAEMKKMMMAVADAIGSLPVQMVLVEDGFLKRAVDVESAAKRLAA
uniref:EF-hand domain-containing protein n=1 Tax=Kalanchoe fedtschenkoi TaxID=63787 RepID=A0A7N0TB55_KALFE